MLLANLLQDVLAVPRPSSRKEHPMVLSQRSTGIHSLPIELLTAIFVLGSGFDYPYVDSPFLLKPDQEYNPPILTHFSAAVSHVCRHWRQVALRTQSLWTTIHVREKAHISRAREYLSRCSASRIYLVDILVDTVAIEDHAPGITLYKDELNTIFGIIVPFVKIWRSFHLKICDNQCKGVARRFLASCGPAPNLETLQLYHFEDFRTTHNLYLATYRPPVTIFDNDLPRLKNISLIGVNLPWDRSPYLTSLSNLELALHLEKVRPPYECWAFMLRSSPEMKTLCLHYSGPKEVTGPSTLAWSNADSKISLAKLKDLSLTDLDPDYLCNLMERLEIPYLTKLSLNLREQNFTPFIESLTTPPEQSSLAITTPAFSLRAEVPPSPHVLHPKPIYWLNKLEILIIRGLDCSLQKWVTLLRALHDLRILEVDFAKVPAGFWKAIIQESTPGIDYKTPTRMQCTDRHLRHILLPRLEIFKISGVSGEDIIAALRHRYRYPREQDRSSEKWVIKWSERRRRKDFELDTLVDRGFWIPQYGSELRPGTKVIIDTFDDDDDEIEEADDETPAISNEDEDENSSSDNGL